MEKSIEQLKKKLTNPLRGLIPKNLTDVEERFMEIAKNLFENYCLKSDTKAFRFAEIEFYYYKKGGRCNLDEEWVEKWNKVTYPRDKNAGELFFHYSGVDICFQSIFKDNNVEFGGILIRSVLEEDEETTKLHAGPQYCANLILNSCVNHLPQLAELEVTKRKECELKTAVRFGIDKAEREREEKDDFRLCFYLDNLNWEKASERTVWNTKQGEYKERTRNYEKERFSNIHKKDN